MIVIEVLMLISAIAAAYYAWKANNISKKANDKAEKANKTAEKANEIAKQTGFYEYYNKLHEIDRKLIEFIETLQMSNNVKEAADLMGTLCDNLSDFTEGDQKIPFPVGTNEVFNEIYSECKKINKIMETLISTIVTFNENHDDTNNTRALSYKKENLSQESQGEYDRQVNIIDDKTGNLIRFISGLIDEEK